MLETDCVIEKRITITTRNEYNKISQERIKVSFKKKY